MYLKSIEINGFKSFSDKIKLDFKKGITSIVGPNGSGKSNILDAILWVLGEQSHKSIRAKEGTDVIFSGGKNKSPKGMAQVALIIDNSDSFLQIGYNEVKIERRIFRSGENEYYINNQKVRLKDINELFLDTGIGKNAYSIIGQGKVEQIILSNPKEIRNIIEEAAGIKKVKSRKEEAEKNLTNVEEDIEKIGYIEEEIKNSLDPLKEQAEKTKEYIELKKEAERKQKRVLKRTIIDKKNGISTIEAKLELQKITISELENNYDLNQKELENINETREKKEETIEKLESELSTNKEQNERFVSKLDIIAERKINAEREILEKEDAIKEYNEKIELKKNKIAFIESEYAKIAGESAKSEGDIVKKKNEFEELEKNVKELERVIDEKKKELVNFEIERVREQNSAEIGKKSIKSSETVILKISEEALNEQNYKNEKENELKKYNSEIDILNDKLLEINIEKEHKQNEKIDLDGKIEKYNKEISEYSYKLQTKESRKEALTKLEDANEGFFTGVKEILNMKKDGVHGAFLSIIKIPEEYENAIQASSGNSMQDIVVENSNIAKECIEILKIKKLGRASFLPFDTIKPFNQQKIGGTGIIGVAADLVEYDKKFEKVVRFVLGNTLIVKDIDTAVRVSKEGGFNGTLVSLEGDVISGRGKITGGENLKSGISVIFERRREIKVLKEEVKRIYDEINNKKAVKIEAEEIVISLNERIKKIDISENEFRNRVKELQLLGTSLEKELKRCSQNLETILYEKEMEEESLKSALLRIETSKKESERITNLIEISKKFISENENYLKELKKSYEEKSESYSQERIAAAQVFEKLKSYEDKLMYEKEEIKSINESYKGQAERVEKLKNSLVILEKECISVKNEKIIIEQKILEVNGLLKNEKEKYKELESAEKDAIIKLKDFENRIVNEKNSFTKKSEEIEKLKVEIEFLKEKAEQIGGIDEVEPSEDASKEQKEQEKIEKKIETLGAVNLLAIEEFARVNEKYSFILEQRQDLIKSRNSLKKLIEEIEKEMMEKFFEAYEKIRENFAYMCQEVLNSSDGDIYLTEPDNLLETGVELMVKFKNKKYQTLTLLSGGEKSMIAVAFIMAIFMYKPSPFTFFDEIEAALDEANTKKLIKMLKNFTEMSQFMLITHNKETMKESDMLYGVTMNKEIGSSKIITVEI